MIKLVALLKRKPGMSRKEFNDRWLIEHTKLSSKLPNCLEYRINLCLEDQPAELGKEPPYDGTAELWWKDKATMEASFESDLAKIAGQDADQFCEIRTHLYTEEYFVVRDGQPVQPPEAAR
ncbi:MAG: EthD family reductase [Opitutales bacterium]